MSIWASRIQSLQKGLFQAYFLVQGIPDLSAVDAGFMRFLSSAGSTPKAPPDSDFRDEAKFFVKIEQ